MLLGDFLAHLVGQQLNNQQDLVKKSIKPPPHILSKNGNSLSITWIELLLQTPLSNARKYCIWRILSPYLINKRRVSYDKAYSIIETWLEKCDELEPLDFDSDYKINEGLNGVLDKEYYPIAFNDLKEENLELYNIIWNIVRCKDAR